MQMEVMGADDEDRERPCPYELHLGEWHGFNEVSLKSGSSLRLLNTALRQSRGANIYFIFNRSASGHSGIVES